MFNYIPSFRNYGLTEINFNEYKIAWDKFGGSLATHPEFIHTLSNLVDIETRYFAKLVDSKIILAIPTWGRHIALSKEVLRKKNRLGLFDLGSAEVILPQDRQSTSLKHLTMPMRFKSSNLSSLNLPTLTRIRRQKNKIALAKPPSSHSKKFHYNQRRMRRIIEEQGAKINPITHYTPEQIASIYKELHTMRWGTPPLASKNLEYIFKCFYSYLTGNIVEYQETPIAIQILFRTESPQWICVDYVNGGVNPSTNYLSPGSVLLYANTQDEWLNAETKSKQLRYSFGLMKKNQTSYKNIWCTHSEAFKTWY